LDPEILEFESRYLQPQVVICEQSTPTVREFVTSWVEIQQRDPLQVMVNIRGRAKLVSDISFDELISVIDQTADLARAA